jgi:ornithine cyclodeaminase/alanine dehydrogenase-like protein (mu-crystallin family)
MRVIDRDEVARRLTYEVCIPIVRDAMIAFSRGQTKQLLRSILPLSEGRLFGVMPGALGDNAPFGAKIISVFHDNFAKGRQSHQGLVVLFDPATGEPVCVAQLARSPRSARPPRAPWPPLRSHAPKHAASRSSATASRP